MAGNTSADRVWELLREVKDPEIPVLSLVDLRVIRDVKVDDEGVVVTMTPTFAGCPAMELMKREVLAILHENGFLEAQIDVVLSPPWSTDTLTEESRSKLTEFGIAPPPPKSHSLEATLLLPVKCPFCHSEQTRLESSFGATLCKQLFYCDNCRQSFERFKPL